jgi:MraZ protein
MLHGSSVYTVDDRHRIVLPKSLASELSLHIVVTLGPERNLLLYKYDTWYERCKALESRGMDEISLIWDRFFIATAQKADLDGQGRFVVPESLREFTQIEKGTTIVITGNRDRAEVWQKDAWYRYLESIPTQRVYDVIAAVERKQPPGAPSESP